MRGDNNRPLKEWLQVFVQSPQLRDRLYQKRIEKLWSELMGPMINSYTRKIKLDKQVLILYIDSASLKNELAIMKEQIIQRLNEKLGESFIHDVKIY
jgi:predicted nucleic acid-binding Zn ribbon protein